MRTAAFALLVLATLGCGTASDSAVEPAAPRVASVPATDPRVSELQVLVSELTDQVEVLNARIKKMESGEAMIQQAAARPAETQARPPARQPSSQTQTRPAATPAPVTRPSSASVTDRYREALVLFGRGQINDSRAMFQQVFDADPNGDLADNALYWIGETYFVSGRYREAIEQYRRIETDYPNQNKAPDALLQLGLAQAKLGDLALAQRTLEGLVNRYPYSTAANAAKAEIKRLRY